jgi:lysine 2,3-aminomutase
MTGFLRGRLDVLRDRYGETSPQYLGLARQYLQDPREDVTTPEQHLKHYEAGVTATSGQAIFPLGLERLYRRTLVIEPTLVCLANCRYCLRSNYERHTLTEQQLVDVAKFCGSAENRGLLNEVLITGGDPLVIPRRVEFLLQALVEHAPNVRIVRIATRIVTQDPERIDEEVVQLFQNKPTMRFELATQINHPSELCDESEAALRRVSDLGVRIYAQNVLLKGVNDDLPTLVDLYDRLRLNNIEAHYLFHAIPMIGTHHLRTSLAVGLRLASALTSCGAISGRAKPMFATMTDIGKITVYEGSILRRDGQRVLLQSHYSAEERQIWNPTWQLPPGAEAGPDGRLRVWYLDGED